MDSIIQSEEIWKIIPDTDNKYAVSNLGNVKSLYENKFCRHRGGFIYQRKTERILKDNDNGHGYKIVHLYLNEKRVSKYVHRLVAKAFVDNPYNKPQVNHLDYNRGNNRADNLEWCTAKENTNYSSQNIKKQRNVCTSSTGEKYIYYRKKHNHYRVIVNHKEHTVKTLKEAIELRDKLLKEVM